MYILCNLYILISAEPCPTLMAPPNGNISCNGTQTTHTVCSFECAVGYMLNGSAERTCLPSNEWSGIATKCKILYCETLNAPENGFVILPCDAKFGTICSVQCSDGYYSDSPNPIQMCQVVNNGTVNWSDPPKCIG